ncbi:MAG: AAA family ATPase [Terriglobales bacterium]
MTAIDPQYKRLQALAANPPQKPSEGPTSPVQKVAELPPPTPSMGKSTLAWATFKQLLPPEMLKEKRFVRYFLKDKPEGGTAKIPLGNHSDESTWSTFDECVKALENDKQGIGYCFLGGEIHGLDIDYCRNPKTGQICAEAMVLLSRFQSWAEYSVSGQGIHVFFKGNVRGKQLGETCLQYWNPKNSPRFFALTCNMVGEAFNQLKDVGDEFNYIFATARHISAKIREELKEVDPEQYAKLPTEREPVAEQREKAKTKSRKLHPEFDIQDFLKFYGLEVDNVAKNDIGTCYRLTSCPIKGEKHVGQNSTTTNFILSSDGGLGFHCQSTGCVSWSVAEVIEKLAEDKGAYPHPIYVAEKKQQSTSLRSSRLECVADITIKPEVWLWPGYLSMNQLTHFAGASSEGKSPVTLDLCRPVTTGGAWPDGQPNVVGPRSVIIMASEDDWGDTIAPRLKLAGADVTKIHRFISTIDRGDSVVDVSTNLENDLEELKKQIQSLPDVGLVIIDPITNYLGNKEMNKEEHIRKLLMPISEQIAQALMVSVITVGHLNRRDKDTSPKQRVMGAAAFVGVARQLIMFGSDPEVTDKKYHHIMGEERNQSAPTLKYKTEKVSVDWPGWEDKKVLRVVWGGVSTARIEESINPDKEELKAAIELAAPALKMILPPGVKLSAEQCKELVLGGAYKERPDNFWHRVRKRAGVTSKQDGRKWWWVVEELPSLTQQFDNNQTTEQGAPIQ